MRNPHCRMTGITVALAGLLVMGMAGCGDDDKPTKSDKTPPTVSITQPADAAIDVAVGANIVATFSEALDPASISTTTFTLQQGEFFIAGAVTYAADAATFDPNFNLAYGVAYTATITTGVRDEAGNHLAVNYVWSFTTALPPDVTPPTVASTVPANSATGVALNDVITATFSEPVDPLTVTATSFVVLRGLVPVAGAVSYAGTTATFDPVGDLDASTVYMATITTAITDLAGNAMLAVYDWSFTTATAADVTPPTVSTTVPANNATDVAVATNVTATFDEPMDPATITSATFTLNQGVTPVAGAVSYGGATAVFNPTSDLSTNTVYTATITTGATDLAGNAIAAEHIWSFTTAPPSDVTPPTVTATTPSSDAIDVALDANVTAIFSEAMNGASLTTSTFTLAQGGTPVAGAVSYAGGTATFDPASDLSPGLVYTATVTTGATDVAGNGLAADHVWSFTTLTSPDVTPPMVIATSPADGDTGVATTVVITAEFSEAMDPSTISASTFTVFEGLTPVAGTVGYSGTTATFTPASELSTGALYNVVITTGVTDLAANPMAANYEWEFTTTGPPDVTPPTVVGTSPGDLAVDISTTVSVTATFSEAMNPATITNMTFTLSQSGTPASGTVSYDGATHTATFDPDGNLVSGVLYTATITTSVTDVTGNPLAVDHSWTFTTETGPAVSATVPANNHTNVPLGANITAIFNKPMDPSTISSSSFTLKQGVSVIPGTVSYSGQVAVFNPNSNLVGSTIYTATITTDATDLDGNHLTSNKVWTITTGSLPDNAAPVVLSTDPVNGATGVSTSGTIRAAFTEDMDPSTLTTATFTVTLGLAMKVGTVTYQGTTAIFTPFSPLVSGSVYTATITTGAKDLSGNALASNKVWTFTTGP